MSKKDTWYAFEATIPEDAPYIRFQSKTGETGTRRINNITRATTLSTTTSSLAFGDIHRITNKTKTLNASVSYNNTTYNQQISGTNLPSCYSVTAQTVGETGTKNVPVIFTATNSTALGAHNGNITLSMNGKTVTIPATANVVTTYYGQAKALLVEVRLYLLLPMLLQPQQVMMQILQTQLLPRKVRRLITKQPLPMAIDSWGG